MMGAPSRRNPGHTIAQILLRALPTDVEAVGCSNYNRRNGSQFARCTQAELHGAAFTYADERRDLATSTTFSPGISALQGVTGRGILTGMLGFNLHRRRWI
jgi:hypothetical protein